MVVSGCIKGIQGLGRDMAVCYPREKMERSIRFGRLERVCRIYRKGGGAVNNECADPN